jgi:small-conductance mechanosensitive channel
VNCKEHSDFSLNFEMVYWIKSQDYHLYLDIHQAINLEIFRSLEKENIGFAYPSQTLLIDKNSKIDISQDEITIGDKQ